MDKERKYRIIDIDIDEVSFVDKGANPDARVLIRKREVGHELEAAVRESLEALFHKSATDFKDALTAMEMIEEVEHIRHEFHRMFEALTRSVYSILGDDEITDKQEKVDETIAQFVETVRERAKATKKADLQKSEGQKIDEIQKLTGHVQLGTAKYCSREQFETALEELTKSIRKPGETYEAAYARAARTPDGQLLFRGTLEAKPAPIEKQAEEIVETRDTKAFNEVVAPEAGRLMAEDRSLTEAQAVTKALRENPALYEEYERKRAGL